MSITEFLKSVGYKHYPVANLPDYYIEKALYQKRVASLAVCETNDNLCVNIQMHHFEGSEKSYTVQIIAERNSLWWRLEAYTLNEEELLKRLEELESQLIKMFNSIPAAQASVATESKSGN